MGSTVWGSEPSTLGLGSTLPPVQWLLGYKGVKELGHGTDHPPPTSDEKYNYTSTPPLDLHGLV